MVFDSAFLKRLEALRVALRRFTGGPREGERPGLRRGGSSVFHSHRSYAQGDDIRAIDWNLYARLGSLFVRERTRDDAPELHVVVDTSPSMEFGAPTKLDLARKLAAALGYLVAGEGGDVSLWTGAGSRRFRGPSSASGWLDAAASASGPGSVSDSLARIEGRGLAVVISDFWDDGVDKVMTGLAGAGHALTLLHLLAREELEPAFQGRVMITDSEGASSVTRFVGDEELAQYRTLLEEHVHRWRAWAAKREASYVRCASDVPFEEVCLLYLRGEGVLE